MPTIAIASAPETVGKLTLAHPTSLGAFYFRSVDARRRFLFFAWGAQQVNFWTAAQKLTFNTNFYAPLRDIVQRKLGASAADFIGRLTLG